MRSNRPDTGSPETAGLRLDAVRRYEILDAPLDGDFDDIAEIAAAVCRTPIATVSIVDEDRVWFAAAHGLEGVVQIGAEAGLCASAVLSDDLYVVTDATIDPRTMDHPLVRGELGLRFYAAAPIVTEDGYRLGTVNVIDREPRELTEAQGHQISRLAAVVARHLELRLRAIQTVRDERRLRTDAELRAEAADRSERLRATALAHRDTVHPDRCELGGAGNPCATAPALKVADSWGDSAWGCLEHAEQALIEARGVFLADQSQGVLAEFVRRDESVRG